MFKMRIISLKETYCVCQLICRLMAVIYIYSVKQKKICTCHTFCVQVAELWHFKIWGTYTSRCAVTLIGLAGTQFSVICKEINTKTFAHCSTTRKNLRNYSATLWRNFVLRMCAKSLWPNWMLVFISPVRIGCWFLSAQYNSWVT